MPDKLLKIVLAILVVVVVSEAGYYIYTFNLRSTTAKPDNLFSDSITPAQTAVNTPGNEITRAIDPLISQDTINWIDNEFMPYIVTLESSRRSSKKLFIQEEDSGIVGEVGYDPQDKVFRIQIADSDGKDIFRMKIDDKTLPLKKFSMITNGQKSAINYSEIKSGDKITFITFRDLVNQDIHYNEFLIER